MKNGKLSDWEVRLARLEADVREMKALLQAQQPDSTKPWWESVVGTFANDPVFEEIDRLGREIREKERRKARRARPKAKAKS
jgi:hypothetical protein